MIIWLASYPKSGNTWIRSIVSALLYTDNGIFDLNSKVNYRTTFREVTKLLYQQKTKPTVETDYILEQWKNADNQFTRRAYADAETFCSTVDFKYEEIIKTFEWEFVDALFFKSFGV